MDLPEAIRQGAKLTKPYAGTYFLSRNEEVERSCALGAIVVAMRGMRILEAQNYLGPQMKSDFPELDVIVKMPTTPLNPISAQVNEEAVRGGHRLDTAIWILNDEHGWSREQIADWIEQEVLTGKAVVRSDV